MRIISGEYRNRKLATPEDLSIRPTMDRSKEALFNIIGMDIYDARFLDLFAGSGSIGIEALSRGASKVTCVDNNINSIKIINKNNEIVEGQINVVKSDCVRFVEANTSQWDFIFMDPPYDIDLHIVNKLLEIIFTNNLLLENGKVIIELASDTKFEHPLVYDYRKYGASSFYFFKGA